MTLRAKYGDIGNFGLDSEKKFPFGCVK